MKIFTNEGVFKKLLCIIITITIFSAVIPTNISYASTTAEKIGGTLLSPIASLMIGIGDVLMDIIHNTIYGVENTLIIITRNNEGVGILLTIVAALLAIVVVAAIAYATAGIGVAILAKLGITASITAATVGMIVTVSLGAGVVAGTFTALSWFGDNVVFPMYQVSPEEIFRDEIPLLDVNFFNPKKYYKKYLKKIDNSTLVESNTKGYGNYTIFDIGYLWDAVSRSPSLLADTLGEKTITINEALEYKQFNGMIENVNENLVNNELEDKKITGDKNFSFKIYKKDTEVYNTKTNYFNLTIREATTIHTNRFDIIDNETNSIYMVIKYIETSRWDDYNYWIAWEGADYTILALHNDKLTYELVEPTADGQPGIYKDTEEVSTEIQSTAAHLKPVISKWYYAIRNFVLVVMMVILLYIGIRIMLCGIASEKAKYKNMLTDWIVAICLVFIMHYIMVFAMNLVDGITDIFASLGNVDDPFTNVYQVDDDIITKIDAELRKIGKTAEEFIVKDEAKNDKTVKDEEGNLRRLLYWDAKNLVGMARIQAALCEAKTLTYIGYGIVYLVLVFYTIFFLFTYVKRVLYLTFFTIIAPLVAMTYPIDKLHDGKAQAFNMWFKEYIFNLMIQPVHLLLYTVLVSSAFELSSTNMVYTLVAIGFMMPAEKFIRKMFGFDKAQTPGFLGGAAGAAIAMAGLNKLFHRRPSKGGLGGINSDNEEKADKEDKINIKDDSAVNPVLLANDSGAKQNSNNMSNVLSNEEKQRQVQIEREKMGNAARAAQASIIPGTTTLNRTRGTNDVTPINSDSVNKQFQSQKSKFSKAQEKYKRKQERRDKLRKSFVGRHARGMWAGAKTYGRQKFKRLGTNLATGKPIRAIARTAGGLYLGATGALLGGTLGLASGEMKNVWQNAGVLGAAGYALGARDIKRDQDLDMAYAEYERAQYGSEEEYRKKLLEEQRKAVTENEKKQRELRTYLKLKDEQEAKEYMEEYGECIDAGITDMEDLATIVRLVEDEGWEKDLAITASKYYKKAGGKPKNMGPRDRENIEYQYRNIIDPDREMEDAEAERQVKIMLDKLDLYGKTKDDLTNV